MTGGSSIVFTTKAVANKTFIRKSNSLCKPIVAIYASQLYPQSMCQDMPAGLYTRQVYNDKQEKSRQGKIEFEQLKIWSCQILKPPDLNVKLEASTLQENRKN